MKSVSVGKRCSRLRAVTAFFFFPFFFLPHLNLAQNLSVVVNPKANFEGVKGLVCLCNSVKFRVGLVGNIMGFCSC